VIVWQRRRSDEPTTTVFTMPDAERAGLTKNNPNWQRYPANMLRARAISNAARMGWPDILNGLYSAEEMRDVVNGDTGSGWQATPAATVHVHETPAEPAHLAAEPPRPIRESAARVKPATDRTAQQRAVAELIADAASANVGEDDLLKLAWFNAGVQELGELDGRGVYTLRNIINRPVDALSTAVMDARDGWDQAVAQQAQAALDGEPVEA
jgi:hypothetical protein